PRGRGRRLARARPARLLPCAPIPATPSPADHPYGMPRRTGDAIAKHRAIEQVVIGWPKTAKQHNALAVVLTVVISNVQAQIAITNALRHERTRRLGPDGLGAVVADGVMTHINSDTVVRRTKRPGDG